MQQGRTLRAWWAQAQPRHKPSSARARSQAPVSCGARGGSLPAHMGCIRTTAPEHVCKRQQPAPPPPAGTSEQHEGGAGSLRADRLQGQKRAQESGRTLRGRASPPPSERSCLDQDIEAKGQQQSSAPRRRQKGGRGNNASPRERNQAGGAQSGATSGPVPLDRLLPVGPQLETNYSRGTLMSTRA